MSKDYKTIARDFLQSIQEANVDRLTAMFSGIAQSERFEAEIKNTPEMSNNYTAIIRALERLPDIVWTEAYGRRNRDWLADADRWADEIARAVRQQTDAIIAELRAQGVAEAWAAKLKAEQSVTSGPIFNGSGDVIPK